MAIITLTTDLGLKDYYVSTIKGAILSQLPGVTIVDISHDIQPFDISQASFIIKNSYSSFPEGTIHIIGVNTQPDNDTPYIGVYAHGHYFIGADNGIFSLLFDIHPEKIVQLTLKPEKNLLTFPVRDIFVKAACHLARGGTLEVIGTIKHSLTERMLFKPHTSAGAIRGMAMYIDSYENVICNINLQLFREIGRGRPFNIHMRTNSVDMLSESYNDVADGEIVAMFNSAGYLEIAINKGKASSLLNLKLGDTISIEFE
jgi:S-adenosylmethionine hydrolase